MRPNIAKHPMEWLLYFPVGLLAVAALSLVVFISWPPYLVYQLGRYIIYLWRDDT